MNVFLLSDITLLNFTIKITNVQNIPDVRQINVRNFHSASFTFHSIR